MIEIKKELKELAKEKIKTYEFFIKYTDPGYTREFYKLKLECWKILDIIFDGGKTKWIC